MMINDELIMWLVMVDNWWWLMNEWMNEWHCLFTALAATKLDNSGGQYNLQIFWHNKLRETWELDQN